MRGTGERGGAVAHARTCMRVSSHIRGPRAHERASEASDPNPPRPHPWPPPWPPITCRHASILSRPFAAARRARAPAHRTCARPRRVDLEQQHDDRHEVRHVAHEPEYVHHGERRWRWRRPLGALPRFSARCLPPGVRAGARRGGDAARCLAHAAGGGGRGGGARMRRAFCSFPRRFARFFRRRNAIKIHPASRHPLR